MPAVWLLSTRGRPKEAQATIDACQKAGMTSHGVVYCDETPYPRLKLPKNWSYHHEPEWLSLQGSMQWVYNNYPDATQYGWLADDTRPRTPSWDRLLEAAAGNWNLSYANDQWLSKDPIERDRLLLGYNLSSGLCWGGNLVRAVGWWALPGVRQAGIDTAWCDIARTFDLHKYQDDIVVEHWNWRTGKRRKDAGDSWQRDGADYIEKDLKAKDDWAFGGGLRNTVDLLLWAFREPRTIRFTYKMEELRINELFHQTGGAIKPSDLEFLHVLERVMKHQEKMEADLANA